MKLDARQRATARALVKRVRRLKQHGEFFDDPQGARYVFVSHTEARTMRTYLYPHPLAARLGMLIDQTSKDNKVKVGVTFAANLTEHLSRLARPPAKRKRPIKRGRLYEAALSELRNSPRKPPIRVSYRQREARIGRLRRDP